ncbi:LLM class F420-dependent oxidoreductase [Hyphomicrobiales bacterium]|nr:LLM class F420-dependent oxidoreductase [Hyphomicrobiales bacterium]CAH1691979.1 LLM class F420-dependent oxidoreductase [Hyphomicrobiales bacterium]
MRLGVTFPQIEIGPDPAAVRTFAEAVEALGYDYLTISDHVLGADMEQHRDWRPRAGQPPIYTKDDLFHEPLVLMGYLAAVTKKIGLATGVLVAPQRQTVLIAKQAAEVDVLSGGRLRLVIGTGWNDLEYRCLGMDFKDRGRRVEEQIKVLRELWTKESVTYEGVYHEIRGAGLNPLPCQRPIPLWLGGKADVVLDRVARLADGWSPPSAMTEPEIAESIKRLGMVAHSIGRDAAEIGIEGILRLRGRSITETLKDLDMWSRLGATKVTFNTESDVMWRRLSGEAPDAPHLGFDLQSRIGMLADFIGQAKRAGFTQ